MQPDLAGDDCVSDAQVATYEVDGIVRIPGLFALWVARLSEAVLDVIKRQRRGEVLPRSAQFAYQNDLSVFEEFGGGAMALNIVGHHPGFAAWLADSAAAEASAAITASARIRFWVDASFYKDVAQAAEGTPWHNDTCTRPFWGKQMTILWIALTDIGAEDGPLTTVRGSHRGDGRYYSPFFPATACSCTRARSMARNLGARRAARRACRSVRAGWVTM